MLGDCPVTWEDSEQRPSAITHSPPKIKTSVSQSTARVDGRDFRDGENTRQHDAFDAEVAYIEVDRIGSGSGGLHREMQALSGMAARGVFQQTGIGDDQRIRAGLDRGVDGAMPERLPPAAGNVLMATSTLASWRWA